jgi:hypothetical protein
MVYRRHCINPSCGQILPYDGQDDGIFNFSDNYLVTYEVARSYICGMMTSPLPFYSHWSSMCDAYEAKGLGRQALFNADTHR